MKAKEFRNQVRDSLTQKAIELFNIENDESPLNNVEVDDDYLLYTIDFLVNFHTNSPPMKDNSKEGDDELEDKMLGTIPDMYSLRQVENNYWKLLHKRVAIAGIHRFTDENDSIYYCITSHYRIQSTDSAKIYADKYTVVRQVIHEYESYNSYPDADESDELPKPKISKSSQQGERITFSEYPEYTATLVKPDYWIIYYQRGKIAEVVYKNSDEGCGLEHVLSYHGTCPCCEYDRCPQSYLITCALCPIWDSDNKCYSLEEKPTALFTLWRGSTSDTERQFYAKQIADMAKENYDLLYTLGYRIELERENVY